MMGERTVGLEMTWIRKISAIERLCGACGQLSSIGRSMVERLLSLEVVAEEARDEDLP